MEMTGSNSSRQGETGKRCTYERAQRSIQGANRWISFGYQYPSHDRAEWT